MYSNFSFILQILHTLFIATSEKTRIKMIEGSSLHWEHKYECQMIEVGCLLGMKNTFSTRATYTIPICFGSHIVY